MSGRWIRPRPGIIQSRSYRYSGSYIGTAKRGWAITGSMRRLLNQSGRSHAGNAPLPVVSRAEMRRGTVTFGIELGEQSQRRGRDTAACRLRERPPRRRALPSAVERRARVARSHAAAGSCASVCKLDAGGLQSSAGTATCCCRAIVRARLARACSASVLDGDARPVPGKPDRIEAQTVGVTGRDLQLANVRAAGNRNQASQQRRVRGAGERGVGAAPPSPARWE